MVLLRRRADFSGKPPLSVDYSPPFKQFIYYLMQNHERNAMQFRKDCEIKGCQVMNVFVPGAVKNTEKDRK